MRPFSHLFGKLDWTVPGRMNPGLRPGLALRLALIGLRRSPGTTLLAVAVLTLGLAAPTTFFSLLVGAIRPLPVPDGDQVVRVEVTQPARGGAPLPVGLEDLRGLQGSGALESLGAFRTFQGAMVEPGRTATRFSGAALTPEVLPLLGVSPVMGRVPGPTEAGETILLGHQLWQEAFDGDPEVLGRVVVVNEIPRAISGILPAGFGFPFNQGAWTILDGGVRDSEPVELVGRLTPGASLESARAELSALWSRRDPLRAPEDSGGRVSVEGFTGGRGEGGEGIAFLGLVLMALALLLIACANVANLLLVRATERVRNLAVQSAVGAGGGQIGLQLLLESLVVAVLGGVAGAFLAWLAVGGIQRGLAAEHFGYFWMRMAVDGKVLVFTAVLVLGSGLVAGLLPALRVLRTDLQEVLKEESTGVSMGGGGPWSRAFVTIQLALSCAALVAAGLTGAALIRGRSFGEGVSGDQVLVASLSVDTVPDQPGARELENALGSIPGVESAGIGLGAPGYMERWSRVAVGGAAGESREGGESVLWNAVTPGFFRVFGLDARLGRLLTEGEGPESPPVAVVSESFVRRFLPGDDPLGARVRLMGAESADWITVVGVVGDLDLGGGSGRRRDRLYLSLLQLPSSEVMVMARTGGEPLALAREVRRRVAEVDPSIPVWSLRTLADAYAYLVRVPRAMGTMALGGGVAGLLVAAVGLYGLLAFRVRHRRRELGLRLALGADGLTLARAIFSLALRQLAPAVAAGLGVGWLSAPLISVALLGGDPRSPLVFVGVAGVFFAVGFAAALGPAIRAASLEPARVLRGD